MVNKNQNINVTKTVKKHLEDVLVLSNKINATINVIYDYCKYHADSETVHNILYMLADVEAKSESTCKILCKILDDDIKQVPEFIEKIKSIDTSNIVFTD